MLPGPVDKRVREQFIAETGGNPLALIELPREVTPARVAGGFGMPAALPVAGRIEGSFRHQIDALPEQTQLLLLVAAADPTGDPALIWRAAARLGVGADAATPAAEGRLADFGTRVRFRHPLVRSAAYQLVSAHDRRKAHQTLADVTDAATDPDRRAWHQAHAAAGPDEEIAAELECSAGRAQARGGLAAAAAFYLARWNEDAEPFEWTATAGQILDEIAMIGHDLKNCALTTSSKDNTLTRHYSAIVKHSYAQTKRGRPQPDAWTKG